MTLLEMSASYRSSAAAIHGRIVELRGQERAQADPEAAFRLRRRIDELTPLWREARERELTPRQRQLVDLYYDQGMNIPQIARELGLNRSTVSRTLRRAKARLYRCLRYSL